MIRFGGCDGSQGMNSGGRCLELLLNALLFMLIACIISHCRHGVYDFKNSRRNNTYCGSPNASIAKLGLKNGPCMIEDQVRVDKRSYTD